MSGPRPSANHTRDRIIRPDFRHLAAPVADQPIVESLEWSVRVRPFALIFLVGLWMHSLAAAAALTPPPPMVDGDCNEYAALGAHQQVVDESVTLSVYQDRHYVWICYTLPAHSFGLLDMRVEGDALPKPVNLHVSAQLGEWPADEPDAVPQDPDSDTWWRTHGWVANWQWFHGVDTSGATPRARFVFARGRELQLSRERFGDGPIHLVLDIARIRRADGSEYTLRIPGTGRYTVPAVIGTSP